jgi:hypothetical protein
MTDLPTPPPPPVGHILVHRLLLTERRTLVWMNVIGSLGFMLALAAVFSLLAVYHHVGAPLVLDGLPTSLPVWVYLLMAVGTLILHEGLHGAAIGVLGYRPRFGLKLRRLVLYTTADAYFSRRQYLAVTLAPLLGITLVGLPVMLLLPVSLAAWVGMMVAMNAASSIGDLWMTAVMVSFPADALFLDEADGMSIFLPTG